MKGNSPNNLAKAGGFISIGGAIVFAVIAFFVYFAWTKVRTDNCLQNAYESYNKQWATTCKSLKRNGRPDCSLPRILANDLENSLQKEKNFCVSYG